MATALPPERLTWLDDLRQALSRSEDRLPAATTPEDAQELYAGLDRVADLWAMQAADGADADVRGEAARWQRVQAQVLRRGPALLRAWGGPAGLAAARRVVQPPPDRAWWTLDQHVAGVRARRMRRVLAAAVAAAALLWLANFVLSRLFPSNPQAKEAMFLWVEGNNALTQGQYDQAFTLLGQAVALPSPDPEYLILYGVAADLTDHPEAAEDAWRKARRLLNGDEAQFLTLRGSGYFFSKQSAAALSDLQAATALDPQSSRAYLFHGLTLETQDRFQEALVSLTRASELAETQGSAELMVMARSEIAALLKRMQTAPPVPTP